MVVPKMLLHSTNEKARNYFCKDLSDLGDDFVNRELHHPLPQTLKDQALKNPYLNLAKILADNKYLLELASWHHLCHSLKSASWLDREYRDSIRDKIEDFYTMLRCPAKELDAAKARYGSGYPAARDVDILRSQYADAINRCYYAAYYSFKEEAWSNFLKDPWAFFCKVREVVQSDSYIEHWLPRLVSLQDAQGSLSLQKRLGLLRDKLKFLETFGKIEKPNQEPANVDSVVAKLAKDVGEMGIAPNATMISPDSKVWLYSSVHSHGND